MGDDRSDAAVANGDSGGPDAAGNDNPFACDDEVC